MPRSESGKDYMRPAVFDRWNRHPPGRIERWMFGHPGAASAIVTALFFSGFLLSALFHWAMTVVAIAVTIGIGSLARRHYLEQADLYREWQQRDAPRTDLDPPPDTSRGDA